MKQTKKVKCEKETARKTNELHLPECYTKPMVSMVTLLGSARTGETQKLLWVKNT